MDNIATASADATELAYQRVVAITDEQEHIDLTRELGRVERIADRHHRYGDRDVWRPFNPSDPWSPLVNRNGDVVGA